VVKLPFYDPEWKKATPVADKPRKAKK
jgi:hypothetical protein